MLARPQVRLGGMVQDATAARPLLDQKAISPNATAAGVQLSAANILSGVLSRTNGGGAGFNDTWPNADDVIATLENPQIGDSWLFIYRNGVAFAMTWVAGTGIVQGSGTVNIAASSTRLYLHTLLSVKRSTVLVGNQVNATAIISGLSNAQIATIEPGMGVTGTNIAANSVVLGVTPSDTPLGATITLNNNVTATLNNNPLSFFPRIQVDGLGLMTA